MSDSFKIGDVVTMPHQPSFLEKLLIWFRLKPKKETSEWVVTGISQGRYGKMEEVKR